MNKGWSNELKDIFKILFEKKPEARIKNIQDIKQHPWFASINWQ